MAKLSPIFNEAQFINGIPANGAKVFTYVAGSSTKQSTYTDEAGLVAQANPIILNSRGEPNSPIWLTEGLSYKFVFTASTDTDPPTSPIRTIDDIEGINDSSTTIDQWVQSGLTPTFVSTTQFTLPGDQTSAFQVNRRVKLLITAGTVYGYVSVSAFAALTTVNVVLDSGVLDSGLSNVQLGLITPTNTSLFVIQNSNLSNSYINDLSNVNFDYGVDYAAIADGSDSGNKKKSILSASKILPITASVAANALTITLNPTTLDFRDATLTSGTVNTRTVAAAISVVVSSGSTLGTVNAVQSRLIVLAIDNAGTVELAVANVKCNDNFDESGVISTTAEGGAGAADSETVIYSTTARTNVPYRVVGFIESTQATAGTWATAPSLIQGGGGRSLNSAFGIGYFDGQGASVTQLTSKTTAVTLNKLTGRITTHNAALAAGATVTFVVNNNQLVGLEVPIAASASGNYTANISYVTAGSFAIRLTNISGGSLSDAVIINFAIIKGSDS